MADSEFLIGIAPEEPQTDTEISIGLPETKPEALMTPNIGVIGVGGAGVGVEGEGEVEGDVVALFVGFEVGTV